MNKLFIGLLIVAAGAGIFFLLRKKQQPEVTSAIDRKLLTGKWQTVLSGTDAAAWQYRYDFQKDGQLVRSVSDSLKADTLRYAWEKTGHLSFTRNPSDTVKQTFTVLHLSADSLQMRSPDSTGIVFTRVK